MGAIFFENKCAKKLELEKDKMDNSDVPEILTMSHFSTPLNQIGLGYGSPFISVPYNTPEGYRNQMMTPSIFQSPRLMSTFQTATNLNLRQRVPFTPTLTNASRLASSSWRQVPEMPSERVSTPKVSRDGVRFASSERVLLVPQLEVESESATQMEKSVGKRFHGKQQEEEDRLVPNNSEVDQPQKKRRKRYLV